MQDGFTLDDVRGTGERAEELRKLWDATAPAPESIDDGAWFFSPVGLPRPVWLAYEGCARHLGYAVEVLPFETVNRVIVAALDAEPRGESEAMLAAAEMLQSIAVAEGWEEVFLD